MVTDDDKFRAAAIEEGGCCVSAGARIAYDPKIDFPLDKTIQGSGDSLYGTSNGKYKLTRVFSNYKDDESDYHELRVEGENLNWWQYTDSKIEIELLDYLKGVVPGLQDLSWSEQGMQPERGWSFDATIEKTEA